MKYTRMKGSASTSKNNTPTIGNFKINEIGQKQLKKKLFVEEIKNNYEDPEIE